MYLLQAATAFLLVVTTAAQIQFSPASYFNEMLEEQPEGTEVVRVGAAYLDTFGRVRTDGLFSLSSEGDAQFFTIETTAGSQGIIRTGLVFDRDPVGAQTEFVFAVTYTTPDGLISSVPVNIFLADINDNAPRFSADVFSVNLLEDTPGGSSVFTVTASDPDVSLREQVIVNIADNLQDIVEMYTITNGRVLYSITSGNEREHFEINEDSGVLSLVQGVVLDIDLLDLYNLSVMATDGGGLTDRATVVVNVLDSNDNPPVISSPLGVNLTLSEDTSVGYVVLDSINATDLDRGVNAEIRFLILSGDLTQSFFINETSGRLTVSGPLDREREAVINLTVSARDEGLPHFLQDTIQVVIHLLDVNDYAPAFVQPSLTALINENSRAQSNVLQVEAIDLDEGPNGNVTYSILEGGEGNFIIDPLSGVISTTQILDREETESYSLMVEAVDNPTNHTLQLSSVVMVIVSVGDLNDNSPIFAQSSYNSSILDDFRRGDEVLQVFASDADTGTNGRIVYEIIGPDQTNQNVFAVDATSGSVYLNHPIRFEDQVSYNFTIQALDRGAFPLADNTLVTVYIHNVNENPPEFDQSEYNVTILETTSIGTIVLQVIAHDMDGGPSGEVKYRVVTEFDGAGSFSVGELFGQVFVNSTLDFDFRDSVFFVVEAYDGGFPQPMTDRTNVTIVLIGENDEAPSIIFPEEFVPSVPENEGAGIEIVILSDFTSDPDFGSGGEFTFSLVDIYDPLSQNASFELDETTGLVTSLRSDFDRESQPEGIVVAVETIDFGSPRQSKVTNITIMIGDKNDNAPYFVTTAVAQVYEFMPPGTEVLRSYRALDDDIGINARVEYSIYSGEGAERFEIDAATGAIFTTEVLNKTVRNYYNLSIIAVDQGTVPLFGFGSVFVEVLDANDRVPVFTELIYIANISEAAPPGSLVTRVTATDSDIGTNAVLVYHIGSNQTNSSRFAINSNTGEVFTMAEFDRESESDLDIRVVAVDNGLMPLTSSATVRVYIQDVNDNEPVFSSPVYNSSVIENAQNGTVVIRVLATDSDAEEPNNIVRYSLSGSRSEAFSIDPVTGQVEVSGEVDRELGEAFSIIVTATDEGPIPFESTAELLIIIEDVNDQTPEFVQSSLSLSIFENSLAGNETEVGYVAAIDSDSIGKNSRITYSILMDFSNGRFDLDSESGLVTFVRGSLDREARPVFDLLIRASDGGSPQLHTDATLNITILDSNEFSPVFDRDLYTGSVAERAVLGTSVLRVRAVDIDIGSNGELRYSIMNQVGNYFQVDEVSGVVSTSSELFDFENVDMFEFEVFVTDLGTPVRLTNTALVRIAITDSNDNAPLFERPQYSDSIRENLASGTTILRVFATDADTGSNADIEYSVQGEGSEYFGIDSETGVLYTNRYINREETPSFTLLITANNSASSAPLHSTVQAFINVTDLNDMHPTFDLVTHVDVREDTVVDSVVFTLSPQDGDLGSNGIVVFFLVQETGGYFSLNQESGDVMLLKPLDYESRDLFVLTIMASDSGNPSLSNFTNVFVNVVDVNDNTPEFITRALSTTVSFATPVGTRVLTLPAQDRDSSSNGQLDYSILAGNDFGLFELASTGDGSVHTLSSLQAYPGVTFSLILQVSNPNSNLSDLAAVNISVLDGTSGSPQFSNQFYSTELSEAATTGDVLFDFSGETVNIVTFSLKTPPTLTDGTAIFGIDSTLGIVFVASSAALDYEMQPLYLLTIEGQNSLGNSAHAVLNVMIGDENDHPPLFVSESYFVAVPETTPTNQPFFVVPADDGDGSSPANVISYSITTADVFVSSLFGINQQTGELVLRGSLDFEFGVRTFNLSVSATNAMSAVQLSSEVTVIVEVLNGNSFSPVFDRDPYVVFLLENTTAGLNIANVSASDRDDGSSGDITYGLHGNHRYLDFRIDTYTGQVFVNHPLDYELTTYYTLRVIAADGGNPSRSTMASVLVQIQDLNDNSPVWNISAYDVTISESLPVGSSVTSVFASDADQVDRDVNGVLYITNGYVTYSIAEGDPIGQFSIHPDTGVVTVASSLDRELFQEYLLVLRATDGGGRFSSASLRVRLTDVNDQIPTFTQNPHLASVPENSVNQTLIATILAVDTDLSLNSEVTYQFSNPPGNNLDPSGMFFLNGTTGEIFSIVPIDREEMDLFTLVVEAVDMGPTPLTGTATVRVQVLDINEFSPQFTEVVFVGEVFENEPRGASVLQLVSSDLDHGENRTVLYSILEGNSLNLFAIVASTGVIEVANSIDFELIGSLDLVVMVTDSGPMETRLSNRTNVTIFVRDRNDNQPVLEDSYMVLISEGFSLGDVVLLVSASDADSGINAQVSYTINSLGNAGVEQNFDINPQTGEIISSGSVFDRELTETYQFIVNATDGGTPQRHASALVTVTIVDINDNHPQFTQSFFQGSVFENSPSGTLIVSASATDADAGLNGDISYEILEFVQNQDDCLSICQNQSVCNSPLSNVTLANDTAISINRQTGEVFTTESLDRESVDSYILAVRASDLAVNETRLSTSVCVLVNVLDQNDEQPLFSRDLFEAGISEYAQIGDFVVQVTAVDRDESTNAEITFELVSGTGNFAINPSTGVIVSLTGDYDRERQDAYNVTVVARDGGSVSLSSSALVSVSILDENDSPPIFPQATFSAAVVENLPPGEPILQAAATDLDIGSNGNLTYSIATVSPQAHFAINRVTGVVSTTRELDREAVDSYIVTIMAVDGGSPPLSAISLVNVIVLDTNDNPPEFIDLPYITRIEEGYSSTSQPLTLVTAVDGDIGSNAAVVYSIGSVYPPSNAFTVNTTSGEVYLVAPLDAEVSINYSLVINASNGDALPGQSSLAVVNVHVIDLNDNAPHFEQSSYSLPLLEDTPIGSSVIALQAFDADATNQNSDVRYEISGSFSSSLFSINYTSGDVSVTGILDRETDPIHILEITVSDTGVPTLTATSTLTIVVQDFNDNDPVFNENFYTFRILENVSPMSSVGRILATDVDVQNVSYYLLESEEFEVDTDSGEIFTAAALDREKQELYSFVAVATDGGSVIERTAQVVVNVTLIDLNDFAPSFGNSSYLVDVYENATVGSVLLTVEAMDEDVGASSTLLYSILSANYSQVFSINASTGEIKLEVTLDRETQDLFSILLMSHDLGDPSLTGTVAVLFRILDNNDNTPVLAETEYMASVRENTALGGTVLTVRATDRDTGQNADVSYYLIDTLDGTFVIGEKSGVIVIAQDLDYEASQAFSFMVVAQDNGVEPRSTTSPVYIEVLDQNDNPPVFDSDVYTVSIPENSILGSLVFQVPATDIDATSNSELRYSITSGNLAAVFSIDEAFSLIAVSDYLDREIVSTYRLGLRVVDSGSPQLTATATLEVNVLDVNDHSPQFESKTYSVSIPESLGTGVEFFRVVATDLDSGRNAELTYSIVAGNTNGDFQLDSSTGAIQPTQEIDFERTRSYALTILVMDSGSPLQLTDTATLRVSVTDINEHAPSFSHSLFYVNVSENSVVGTPVGFFVANDQDTTSRVTYSLLGSCPFLAVDSLEGTLYVSTALTVDECMLTLDASDGVHVTIVTVHVTVVPLSLAFSLPLFRQAAFYFEISEAATVSAVVGTLDQTGVSVVGTVFDVDISGNLILIGQLDREATPIYIFNAMATHSSSAQLLYVIVTVRVLDENDNPPTIESSEYHVVVSELTQIGTPLLTLRAFDVDSPGDNADYSLVLSSMGNIGGKFTIDPLTGELLVNGSLDYDVLRNYNLTVVASNTLASSPLNTSASVTVELVDENDNSPVFSRSIYQVSVSDSVPLGTEILILEADDFDSGTNSELIYSITHVNAPRSFTINSTSGRIATNMIFDTQREGSTSSYVISALVSDRGSPQPRSDTTVIFVSVVPTNIYPPQFSQPDGYSVVIAETLPVGSSILEVSANDFDNPTEEVTFDIISGDPSEKFDIDPSNGAITLSKLLDYTDQMRYMLTISATDSGAPSLASFVAVNVSLLDINNHDPQFDQASYQQEITENIIVGASIIKVSARDPDAASLTYQITVNVYENSLPLFSINATSGEIFSAAPIDREFASAPTLLVSAIDSGYPVRRSNSIPVTILVGDVNDNAPMFRQQNYTIPVVRLLGPGQYVAMVTAVDADIVGEPLVYRISQDSSNGLFEISSSSGQIVTVSEVPEAVGVGFSLTVAVSDGLFETAVLVEVALVDNGEYCNGADFCVRVREVNCTFDIFPFVECNPFCLGESALSPGRRVCLSHHCLDFDLEPCVAMETCQPTNQACAGVCPEGMSVCPTTDLCHVTGLTESCDLSNETCLTGQTLVQRENNSRYCTPSKNLTTSGQNCTNGGLVFCEALNECQNITEPFLCQACPDDLQPCEDTGECVSDLLQCCGTGGEYCDALASCLSTGVRCEQPNIAPVINSSLIYIETFESFQSQPSDQGHLISALLGNVTHPGVDSQGEEIGVAIVQASRVVQSDGEWEYALCLNSVAVSNGSCSGTLSSWVAIGAGLLSETNALVLPNSARVRFVRKVIELDGAVWLRVKLWDGNRDGFISPSKDLVSIHTPAMETTLPFSSIGAFSYNTTLLVIVILPLIAPPSFSRDASLQLSSITEDVVFSSNLGNIVVDIVNSVYVPGFTVLAEDRIEGFEELVMPDSQFFEQLLPVSVKDLYYESVQRVNPTRKERRLTLDSGQSPGVAINLNPNPRGSWQVSLAGDPRLFINLNSVLLSPREILLTNVTVRVRFLPAEHFCGVDFLSVCPWDGYWNRSAPQVRGNGFVVLSEIEFPLTHSSSGVSNYNLNDCEMVKIEVECVPDKPVLLADQVFLDPIPHRIIHSYAHIFTALVDKTSLQVRAERKRLEEFLQITLQLPVDIKRISSALANRTYVSFSVQGNTYTFNEVNSLIQDRQNSLADLGFPVVSLSQDSSYGSGAGCQGDEPQPYHGVHVSTFISRYLLDGDDDFVGMAVVAMDTTAQNLGVWQYHRGNWSSNENQSEQFNPLSNIWINFPSHSSVSLSETRALLLHGNDRLRFLPNPDAYWRGSSSSPGPSLGVKVWDNSNHTPLPEYELATMNINTNPTEDTLQSILYPQGRFSDEVLRIEAARIGCNGVVNSGAVFDACCGCGGSGDLCRGCDGVMASNKVYGACDVCGNDALDLESCFGCDFIPFSGTESGQCSECIRRNSVPDLESSEQLIFRNLSFLDCSGLCHGVALLDACQVCSGGNSPHEPNTDIDCAGACFGGAVTDGCGECTGPGTRLSFDWARDCTGVCHGPFVSDSCGVCQLADEAGNVRENRDCDGVCFGNATIDGCGQCAGGMTNLTADYSLDVCGVCDGDNTMCVGCDGITNSGHTLDTCGRCGGNGCGCFKLDTLTPDRGPRTGGTDVLLRGAGFFLNDSTRLEFQFNESSPNCGAPYVFPDTSASVRITCLFVAANQQLQGRAVPVDQTTIRCTTEPTDSFDVYIREFDVRVRIDSGPFSNPIPFFYDDYSGIFVSDIVPLEREVDVGGVVILRGENFLNTSSLSCLVHNFAQCVFPSVTGLQEPLLIPATFISPSDLSCLLPAAHTPCQVTIQVTLDGQKSGIVNSLLSLFTYRHSAPTVRSVHFSNDLSSLVVQFEQQTDTAVPSLSCVEVFKPNTFDLIGGVDANCLWADNSQRELLVSLPRTASVKVSSPIRFMDDVLITRHQRYSFGISNMTFTVSPGPSSVRPVAIVNGPRFIPPCGHVTFSGTGSQYPGYGGFEFHWMVHVKDSSIEGYTQIVDKLDSLGLGSPSITLNSDLFQLAVEYHLQLYVVNSIGLQSNIESIVLLKEIEPRPSLFILGTLSRQLKPGEDLVVQSVLTPSQCADVPLTGHAYSWTLRKIVDQRRNVFSTVDLSSLKTQSPEIVIPSSFLDHGHDYILSLYAGAVGQSTTDQVVLNVAVLPVSLQALINGGNRTVSQSRVIVFDARNSSQNILLSSASFVWSCRVEGSLNACYNHTLTGQIPVPIFLPALDYLTFPASDLMPERTYIFTVRLQQGGDTSVASIAVTIVSERPPIVEINNPNFIVRSTESLYLEGLVYSSVPMETVYWRSLPLLGQGTVDLSNANVVQSQTSYLPSLDVPQATSVTDYLAVPLEASVTTNQTSRAPLVLSANSLTPGLAYTFRLTAVSREGAGFSQVTIVPSSPPLSSRLIAVPSWGVALETEFVLDVLGTVDDTTNSPFLYTFGIVEDSDIAVTATAVSDHVITWISGVQTSNRLRAVLPSGRGNVNDTLILLARVFNRNNDKSDHMVAVTVQPNPILTRAGYSAIVNAIENKFIITRNWNTALSATTVTLLELNKTKDIEVVAIKEQILQLFVDIFENYLPPSLPHYQMSSSVLRLLSRNVSASPENELKTSATLKSILEWYDREASSEQMSVAVPNQSAGEPLFLQSTYKQDAGSLLTESLARTLLAPLDSLLNSGSSQTPLAKSYVESVDLLTTILCKESYLGDDPTEFSTRQSTVYTLLTEPRGAFNVSGVFVNFKESVMDVFQTQACVTENVPCVETCFTGALYSYDLLDNRSRESSRPQLLQLNSEVQDTLLTEIDGSDPQSVELFSNVMSASVQIPSQSKFLRISDLDVPIQVLFPKNIVVPHQSHLLCLYREVGGGRGFENRQWLLDSLTPPQTLALSGGEYLVCEFNHLTEFAIGILPPPVITTETPPPTTTQPITTTEATTEPTTMTTMATTEPPTIPPEPQSPAAAVAVVIILLLLIIVTVIVVLLIAFFVWKKKRSKSLRIKPGVDEPDGQDESAHLTKATSLTPEQSKVPMQIILCPEDGERKLVGQLNVLPSIRLRELRVQLADNFAIFKSKPFYFMTRQLCDIEPAAEQQQFVSLVFGDKPIFVREVTADTELTKKHFCVCGKAAQFECSNCTSQGYCSTECQHKHWGEQHQKQCSILSERRRRSTFLTGRPGSLFQDPAMPVAALGNLRKATTSNIPSSTSATSPTTPGDWKSFINAGKQFSGVNSNVVSPVNPRTSLSELAAEQPSQPQGGPRTSASVGPLQPRTSASLGPLQPRTSASVGPLQRVPSLGGTSSQSTRRSLPPLSRNVSLQHPVAKSQITSRGLFQARLSNVRVRTAPNVNESSSQGLPAPLQSPLRTQPDLFTRIEPQQDAHQQPLFARNLSIQSVGSEDFGFSMNMPRDLRNEPLLESDEEDYESSTTNGSGSRTSLPASETPVTHTSPVPIVIDSHQTNSSRPTSGMSVSSGKLQSENDSSHKDQEGQSSRDAQPLPDTSKLLEAVPSSTTEQ